MEEYLEVIYSICERKGYARVTDIARRMNIGASTVTEMLGKLSDRGYVNYEKYSGVTLTKKGKKIAMNLKKTHSTLRDFLIIIGVDEDIADEDACKIEHVVNPKTMKTLRAFVEFLQAHESPLWLNKFKEYCAKKDASGEHRKNISAPKS